MEKSKFIRLLKSLKTKELKAFRFFLKGLHHRQEKTLSLFEYILKYSPHFCNDKLDKSYLLRKRIFPSLSNSKRISNELHKLFDWLEQFLLLKKMQNKDHILTKSILLRDIYKERQLPDLYDRKVAAIDKIIRLAPTSSWYHYHLLELRHDQYYYSPTEKIKKGEEKIQGALENLEAFYQIKKLKYECELLSRKNVLGQALREEESVPVSKNLYLLYQQLKQLIVEKTPATYQDLKKEFMTNGVRMAQEDQLIVLSYLINYTGTMILTGDHQGFVDAFELYCYGIDQHIIVENGMISEGKFHNITNVSCELGEYLWAKKFVREYQFFLAPDIRNSASALAEARIAFGEQKYEETLKLLLEVEDKNMAYVLQVKVIQVRSYYELGLTYLSSLNYFIQSFYIFLNRNKKVSEQTLIGTHNFLKILKLLSQRSVSPDVLKAKVDKINIIVCKSWIRQKVRNYQPSRR